MDNLRKTIEILFLRQDPEKLLDASLLSKGVDKEWFKHTFLAEHGPYSGNQAEALYECWLSDTKTKHPKTDPVFASLLRFGQAVLCIKNGDPVCKFEHYLRWHELTALVGEDILTCSYLAKEDFQHFVHRKRFAWNLVLESDNTRLEYLFGKGLAELHCHLNGSSLNFDLNWLALMNEPLYQKETVFKRFGSPNLYGQVLLAAYIRMYLYLKLNNLTTGKEFLEKFGNIWCAGYKLPHLIFGLDDLQTEIGTQAAMRGHYFEKRVIDYAVSATLSPQDEKSRVSRYIIGERRLMYQCFWHIYRQDTEPAGLREMFYFYLLVKQKVRSFMVQSNGTKGFENFKRFDEAKDVFVDKVRNKAYQKLVPRCAFRSYFDNEHIKYLEFRIAPKATSAELRKKLNELSYGFLQDGFDKDKFHCICHFIKNSDNKRCFEDIFINSMVCRNSRERKKYMREAVAIEYLLKGNDQRIVGIDAANSEFGCRPEVFSEVYRRLQHLQRDRSLDMLMLREDRDLGFTYHVGEDYYDVVDGLRAIEEAVLFLNLRDGARLGHAVALGIDASRYYEERKCNVVIPRQDWLDNCVWLLAKMDEYGVEDRAGVRDFLTWEFRYLANELYPGIGITDYKTYFLAWLLRGDNPYLYMGSEEPHYDPILPYGMNHSDNRIEQARKNKEAREIYRAYHFDACAKSRGVEFSEVHLHEGVVTVIEIIQEKMREDMGKRKIAIEVNPTSNLRICNIDTYNMHPVLKFRTYGLPDTNDNRDCPQLSVSINTDDKGIFATSLEKEYTLLALATEKIKGNDGRPKYKSDDILLWIENLREQSFTQCFRSEAQSQYGGHHGDPTMI